MTFVTMKNRSKGQGPNKKQNKKNKRLRYRMYLDIKIAFWFDSIFISPKHLPSKKYTM